jgi:hypothetical protein
MGFTMRISETGARRPAAICDGCGAVVGPLGSVLWGPPAVDEHLGERGYTSFGGEGLAAVATACDEQCRGTVDYRFGAEQAAAGVATWMTVEDYIAYVALASGIDVDATAARGFAQDHGLRHSEEEDQVTD